jgi:Fungalysin metallopeptidase (M36)
MAINFVPNDPLAGAGAPPIRQTSALANRPPNRAGFIFHSQQPQGLHQPGTPEFLFWQCRQGAIAAVKTWESHAGPLSRWFSGRRLHLVQNAVAEFGETPQPNAFYDRSSFSFFEFTQGGKTTFSGESTDVVAHEIGHGLLDAIRPDLWDTPFLETSGFHESFGDCIALLTALADPQTRQAFRPSLNSQNFLETTAEDLSDAIRRFKPNHNAAEPRMALNTLQWQLPSTLPATGGPGVLINEGHSFARIFTGCFYDLLRDLAGNNPTDAVVQQKVSTAARLLIAGARNAPDSTRFFQSVGRAMSLADQQLNNGANRDAIGRAFAAHNIALGTNAMLAPVAELAGTSPRAGARSAALGQATAKDIADRLNVKGRVRMIVRPLQALGARVVEAVHQREVSLGEVHAKLKGVVALAAESVLVGVSGGRAAALGALPDASVTTNEVLSYVNALVKNERIAFDAKSLVKEVKQAAQYATHAVKSVGGKKRLVRLRFACR